MLNNDYRCAHFRLADLICRHGDSQSDLQMWTFVGAIINATVYIMGLEFVALVRQS